MQAENVALLKAAKIVDNELSDASRQVALILERLNDLFLLLFPGVLSDDLPGSAAGDGNDDYDDVSWIGGEETEEAVAGDAGGVPFTLVSHRPGDIFCLD